jgi:hypothetical protein
VVEGTEEQRTHYFYGSQPGQQGTPLHHGFFGKVSNMEERYKKIVTARQTSHNSKTYPVTQRLLPVFTREEG